MDPCPRFMSSRPSKALGSVLPPQPGCAFLQPPCRVWALLPGWANSASQARCQASAQLGATGGSWAAEVGELHGECPSACFSESAHLSFLFSQCHKTCPPHLPSRDPFRTSILFWHPESQLWTFPGKLSELFDQRTGLWNIPNPPGPQPGGQGAAED